MSRRSRRNSVRSDAQQTHREFYSGERDLREHLERRAQQAIHAENSVRRMLYSSEYNMEIQKSERRNSEYALLGSQRELESQRQQLLMANDWADQTQRARIHLCSGSEMRSRLYQEGYERSCQEIEELWRRCNQEENAARQRKLEEFNVQQNQERSEFLEDSRIFQDPDSPSSCGSAHVPHQAHIASSFRKTWR